MKEEVTDVARRMELINASTSYGGPLQNNDNVNLLSGFSKDFEEMYKAIIVRGDDTYRFFSGYS